jgi:hypothetical protein
MQNTKITTTVDGIRYLWDHLPAGPANHFHGIGALSIAPCILLLSIMTLDILYMVHASRDSRRGP